MEYSISVHKHRFASWCACTASRASKNCRFKVSVGSKLLDNIKLNRLLDERSFGNTFETFDSWHKRICNELITEAANANIANFTFGVSAKMLNCYIKAYLLEHTESLQFLHPPIDRLLLIELARKNVGGNSKIWKEFANIGWSNFNEIEYYNVINNIRSCLMPNSGLWAIEQYWQGFQD